MKYFKYSIGEIAIVVLGVLIAIQLNNWNQDWNENSRIENYFHRMQEEIKVNSQLPSENSSFTKNTIIPDLETAKRIVHYNKSDSLLLLFEKIVWLTESESLTFQFPIIEEFVAKGYLSEINDNELNRIFVHYNYSKSQCNVTDELTRNYQIHLIKPFLLKHTPYAALDYYNADRKFDDTVAQALKLLLENREFENLISLYITHLHRSALNFDELTGNLKLIDKRLKEIETESL